MYSFSIENGTIKDNGKFLPDEGSLNNITCLAIKKNIVVFGDSDGNLNKWNIKTKTLNNLALKLGYVKQLKFFNRSENFILLISFLDSIQIFDVNKSLTISTFRTSSKSEITYSDWYDKDKIIVKFSNNTTKLFNLELKTIQEENINLLSLSLNIDISSEIDYLTMLSLLKQFLYKTVYYMCDNEIMHSNIDDFKQSLVHSTQNITMNNIIKHINPILLDILYSSMIKYKNSDKLVKKVNIFAFLSLYLNFNSFETSFWCLLAYVSNENNDKNTFNEMIKNSYMLNQNDFSFRTLEVLKMYKDSGNDLIHELILWDEKEIAFNVLIEANSKNDSEYLNNSLK